MAEDAAATGEAGATGGTIAPDGTGPRRRRGPAEVQEVLDELAQETKRTTLLDCLERQVRDQQGNDRFHVSRIVFGFNIQDDRKPQSLVEQEFKDWRDKQERRTELTGILMFTGHGALQFLEGPTELLFGAVQLFQRLAVDAEPPAVRPAVISQVRIIHFTELHGVRTSASWCSWVNTGKLQGGTQVTLEESACADYVYKVYQKFLLACLRATDQVGDDDEREPDSSAMQNIYKRVPAEMLPNVDEVYTLLSKNTADYFFSFAEFEKVFMAPFQLVLHSELLWPMSPALVY